MKYVKKIREALKRGSKAKASQPKLKRDPKTGQEVLPPKTQKKVDHLNDILSGRVKPKYSPQVGTEKLSPTAQKLVDKLNKV